MFSRAILDTNANLTYEQKRFYSCIRLVADNTLPAVFYIKSDWSKQLLLDESGLEMSDLLHLLQENSPKIPESLRNSIEGMLPSGKADGNEPRLICLEDGSWDLPGDKKGRRPIDLIGDRFVLSPSEIVNQAALLDQGFNANSAILCLAAVGIDLEQI